MRRVVISVESGRYMRGIRTQIPGSRWRSRTAELSEVSRRPTYNKLTLGKDGARQHAEERQTQKQKVEPLTVALLCAELDCEASRVAGGVCRAGLAADGGEADGEGNGGSWCACEELGAGEVWDRVGEGESAVCASTLGVDDALGDTLAVEVGEEVDVVEVWWSAAGRGGRGCESVGRDED